MSHLSKEVLDQGRTLIREGDFDNFCVWVERHVPTTMNRHEIRSAFAGLFMVDVNRALTAFDMFFPQINIKLAMARVFFRQGCFVFVVLGLLGGVLSLLRMLFG